MTYISQNYLWKLHATDKHEIQLQKHEFRDLMRLYWAMVRADLTSAVP